ncbi:MAG: cache domain-containing protein [Candidatus Kapaibacterium sp.]
MKLFKLHWIAIIALFLIASCEDNSVSKSDDEKISAYEAYKQIIKEVGVSESGGIGDVCNNFFTNDSSREDFIRTYVENIRIQDDPSIYVFVYDTNFVNIAHPVLKDYVGTDRSEDTDTKGQNISDIIINTLRQHGEGFVEFYFDNPATNNNEKKTTFVKYIKDTKYLLGIGFYGESLSQSEFEQSEVDKMIVKNCVQTTATGFGDVFAGIVKSNEDRMQFVRDYCDLTRFLKDLSGYFFVDDSDGVSISYPVRKDLENTSLTDIQDVNGVYPVREMLDVINSSGSGFVEYHLENPVSKEIEMKIVYVERIPNSDYFIGTGYYKK